MADFDITQQYFPAGLYLVATPIGNLADITYRAVALLKQVDFIYCEDKRVSARLLHHYQITTPLRLYHDHSDDKIRQSIIADIQSGKRLALISDAGTPLISDPGYKLVNEVLKKGLYVTALPGPCAAITALSLSGLPSDQFYFVGFLPAKLQARRTKLAALDKIKATMIFYETAKRLKQVLSDMAMLWPKRQVAITRELTKLHEEVILTNLQQSLEKIATEEIKEKGEFTIIIEGFKAEDISLDVLMPMIKNDLAAGKSVKDLSHEIADETGIERRKIYRFIQELKDGG